MGLDARATLSGVSVWVVESWYLGSGLFSRADYFGC